MKLILASNSPRRKELLHKLLDNFAIIPAQGEEKSDAQQPSAFVAQLAYNKAAEVWRNNTDSLVLGCDTAVVFDNKILGKPHNRQQARQMLSALSDNTHTVLTGVCLMSAHKTEQFVACTKVVFRKLSDSDIESYIDTGSCYDKAGAYGIQDSDFVSAIEGEYDNVMGLPVCEVGKALQKFGININK